MAEGRIPMPLPIGEGEGWWWYEYWWSQRRRSMRKLVLGRKSTHHITGLKVN